MNDSSAAIIDYAQLEGLKKDLGEDFVEVYEAIFLSISETLEEIRQQPSDEETLTRLFHSLKSPARSLGATRLANQAELFENQSRKNELGNIAAALDSLEQLYAEVKQELGSYQPG